MTQRTGMNELKPWKWVGGVLVAVLALWALFLVIALFTSRSAPLAGEIGVVRSGPSAVWIGSWFNGHRIRSVVPPGSGNTFIGLGSEVHYYPADSVQRNYTITSNTNAGDRPGVDVVEVPTSDGIRVGLEGTFYFTTAFNGSARGESLVRDFDNRFGVRTFPVIGQSATELFPWQGTDGWAAFLDTVVRPIIDNDLRQSIATVTCAQLVSSCALVYQQNVSAVKNGGAANNASIQRIQNSINASLQTDVQSTLGENYFSNIEFRLARVTLPAAIQQEIDNAQAAFAAVGTSRAKLVQAKIDAQTNAQREAGYRACQTCAEIDALRALPSGLTTYAPGKNFSITGR